MRQLILMPLVAAVLLVGCDSGVLGDGKIENFGGQSNRYYQGGIAASCTKASGATARKSPASNAYRPPTASIRPSPTPRPAIGTSLTTVALPSE